MNRGDFARQKEFIREILKEFPIGRDQSQVGVIKYGAGADIEIKFNDYVSFFFQFQLLFVILFSCEKIVFLFTKIGVTYS